MRLLFITYVAAACLEDIGAPAEQSTIITRSARPLPAGEFEVSTTRHLRVNEPAHEEERGSEVETIASAWSLNFKEFEKWVENSHLDHLDKWLELHNEVDDLKTYNLPGLVDEVKSHRTHTHPNNKATLIETLYQKHGGKALEKTLHSAYEYGLKKGMNPDDFFRMMNLDKVGDNFFQQAGLLLWANSYVDKFNGIYSKKTTLYSSLSVVYDDETLIDMLLAAAAREAQSINPLAVRMIIEMASNWRSSVSKMHPRDIYLLLQRFSRDEDFIDTYWFADWLKCVNDFNAGKPEADQVSALTILKSIYGKMLMTILASRKNDSPITKRLAVDFYHYMLKYYGKSEDAFKQDEMILSKVNPTSVTGSAWKPFAEKYHQVFEKRPQKKPRTG